MLRNKGDSIIDLPDDYVLIDIETTGLSTEWDEIIEIAGIKFKNNTPIDTFQSLVRPSEEIDEFIEELTGITNSELEKADNIDIVLPKFKEFISSYVLIGHNINFDINFLYDAFYKNIGYEMQNDYIDTLRIARKTLPELEHHRLDDLISHYSIPARDFHRALGDCKKTSAVFDNLKKEIASKFDSTEEFKQSFKRLSKRLDLSKIVAESAVISEDSPIYGKVCVFTGTLEKMTRKEAAQIVVNMGGINANTVTKKTNLLILGNNDYCKSIKDGKSNKQKKAEELILKGQDLIIIPENEFYEIVEFKDNGSGNSKTV